MTLDLAAIKARAERGEQLEPVYAFRQERVFKEPVSSTDGNGKTTITIGFPVCKPDEIIGPDAGKNIASLMNLGEHYLKDVPALVERVEQLEKALAAIVLVCGPTGDSLEDFERIASAFYNETGYMRPGKDVAAGACQEDLELRTHKFRQWVAAKVAIARAALEQPHG